MTEIPSGIDGELLIRSLLYQSSELSIGQDADLARIRADFAPCPTVPQILVKAGFRRLEIIAGSDDSGNGTPRAFLWQGMDGTQIDTCIQVAEDQFDDITADGAGQKGAELQTWYGEVSHLNKSCMSSLERYRRAVALAFQHNEFLCVVRPEGLANYPQAQLRAAWECLAAVGAVKTDPNSDNDTLLRATLAVYSAQADFELAAAIDTRGLKRPVLVMNNHSFFSNEAVAVPLGPGEKPVTAIGPEGNAEQVQVLNNPNKDGINYALFVARNVPLHGYAVWDLGATLVPTESDDEVTASPTHLENTSIRVEFDHATGLILKIFDKDNERDILNETFEVQRNGKRDLLPAACANMFEIVRDGEAPTFVTQLDSSEVIEAGPVRGAIVFKRALPGGLSSIRQTIRLTARSTRIDFVTEVDWHEDNKSLSVLFPVAINSSRATHELPFGWIERPTYCNDNSRKASTQSGLHRWVDLSEGDYGVTLLSDGPYCCDVQGNRLRLTLFPQDFAADKDDNEHMFTYSLLPHGGDLREGEVVENSYAIARSPVCMPIAGNRTGKMPLERSFFEVDSASIFIATIKRAEQQENAIIVRMHEAHNTRGIVLVSTTLPVKKAWLCDLLENNLAEIPLDNGEALLPFHPFEIITVKYTT